MPFVAFPKANNFTHTAKQDEVMQRVIAAAVSGEFTYPSELNKKISWGPVALTSLVTMIRILEGHGFIRRMYGRPEDRTDISKLKTYGPGDVPIRGHFQFLVPTPLAYTVFKTARS
jgi:hypothetical protein